jgi:hypothetical protein
MKKLTVLILIAFCLPSFGQGKDAKLQGKWILFEVIDNTSGLTVPLTHKGGLSDFSYYIEFRDSLVKYNLELNKCNNQFTVNKKREIEFKYFSSCTEFCCDGDFSVLLNYEECTKYFIKQGNSKEAKQTLIMISEDRIFYFRKN